MRTFEINTRDIGFIVLIGIGLLVLGYMIGNVFPLEKRSTSTASNAWAPAQAAAVETNPKLAADTKPRSPSSEPVCPAAFDAARKIGALVVGEAGKGMVALKQSDAGEITFGCPPRPFLAISAKRGRPVNEFFDFVSFAGSAYTGEAANQVRQAVEKCVSVATATPGGFSRLPFRQFTLDCGGGLNGGPPKVTFEST